MNIRVTCALLIAIILDLADYLVGWIPIAGDFLDLAGIIILLPLIGKYAILPVVEFIPIIGDFLPTFIVSAVFYAKTEAKKKQEAKL